MYQGNHPIFNTWDVKKGIDKKYLVLIFTGLMCWHIEYNSWNSVNIVVKLIQCLPGMNSYGNQYEIIWIGLQLKMKTGQK